MAYLAPTEFVTKMIDAVRAEATIGPVSLDATYAIQQDTIFGSEAGPRRALPV